MEFIAAATIGRDLPHLPVEVRQLIVQAYRNTCDICSNRLRREWDDWDAAIVCVTHLYQGGRWVRICDGCMNYLNELIR